MLLTYVGGGGEGGAIAPPKRLIWSISGQNLWKFGQKLWKPSQKCCMYFDFAKMAPKIKVQTFFLRSCFYLVLSGQIRENFGKFGWNLGKNGAWSALIWKNAPNMNEMQFFEVIFFGVFFRASLGKFGRKSFSPPKICLLLHLWWLSSMRNCENAQYHQTICAVLLLSHSGALSTF